MNYSTPIKKKANIINSYGNRGMGLEMTLAKQINIIG